MDSELRVHAGSDVDTSAADQRLGGATLSCPAGSFDMVDWMTMDPDVASSQYLMGTDGWTQMSSLQIGSASDGNIWNVKRLDGRTWDNYVYDSSTVYQGYTSIVDGTSDPATHFGGPLSKTQWPYVPRCAYPGTGTNIRAPIYAAVKDCRLDPSVNTSPYGSGLTGNGYSRTLVYDVGSVDWGGTLRAQPSIVVSRPYFCDANFQNCQALEEAYYVQRYGLVHWNYYTWVNGAWSPQASVSFNTLTALAQQRQVVNGCPNLFTNVAFGKPVSGDASGIGDAGSAVDMDPATQWNGGSSSTSFDVDLGATYTIDGVRLMIRQWPAGQATYQVWGGPTADLASMTLLTQASAYWSTSPLSWDATSFVQARHIRVVGSTLGPWTAYPNLVVLGR